MASYHMNRREPLLDSNMQAAIERRGKELLGFALIGAALLMALILGSYVPDDPSWMAATDAPAENLLGRFGASIASPLFIVVGWGAWGLVAVPAVWGLRLVTHLGEDRAFGRLILAPIAIALASVYASTNVPTPGWTHSFGMGGLFGDTILGALLGVAPVDTVFGLKVISALVWLAMIAMTLFVLGVDRAELRRFGRFMLVGVILTYAGLRRLIGQSAKGALTAAQRLGEGAGAARAAKAEMPGPVLRAEPPLQAAEAAPESDARPKPGLFARVPAFWRRGGDLEPELVEPELPEDAGGYTAISEERIRARIADVIRSRAGQGRPAGHMPFRSEPPVLRGGPHEPVEIDNDDNEDWDEAPSPAAGEALTIPRAPVADYRAVFGDDPPDRPLSIRLWGDTDNTGTESEADIDNIRLLPASSR